MSGCRCFAPNPAGCIWACLVRRLEGARSGDARVLHQPCGTPAFHSGHLVRQMLPVVPRPPMLRPMHVETITAGEVPGSDACSAPVLVMPVHDSVFGRACCDTDEHGTGGGVVALGVRDRSDGG